MPGSKPGLQSITFCTHLEFSPELWVTRLQGAGSPGLRVSMALPFRQVKPFRSTSCAREGQPDNTRPGRSPVRLQSHTWKAKAALPQVQGQPKLRKETLSQTNRIKQKPNQTKSSNNKEQHLGLIGKNLLMDLDTFMGWSYLQRLKK